MKNNLVVFSDAFNYKMKKMRLSDKIKYIKTDNTILLDKNVDFSDSHLKDFFPNLKNIALDEDKIKRYHTSIRYTLAENIYINNHDNLGGITLPYLYLFQNKVNIEIDNTDSYKSNIKILNIILNDRIETINVENFEKIEISSKGENIKIYISTKKYRKVLIIDEDEIIKEKLLEYKLNEADIKNNTIDLRDYKEYEKIDLNRGFKVSNLIITKDIFKKFFNYQYAIPHIYPKKLCIIDEDEMKLIQNSIDIRIDDEDTINWWRNEDDNWYIYIRGKEGKIIYIDTNDNLKILDAGELEKDKAVKDVTILYSKGYFSNYGEVLMLVKLKNGNYNIFNFDEILKVDILFKKFLLLNLNKYNIKLEYMNEYLESDNWLVSFIKDNSIDKFLDIYDDYIIFKEHIDKLKGLGFSNKALTYLYDRKIDSIINTKYINCVDEMDKEEIDEFNKLGEHYVKQKRLKRGLK